MPNIFSTTKVGMDSSSAGLQVPHSLTQLTERASLLTIACFQRKQTIILHSLHRSLSIADTIAVLVLLSPCRKLVQLPGVIIGGSTCGVIQVFSKNSALLYHVAHQEP